VPCQDNLLNLPFSSQHLPDQYYYLWPVSLDVVAAEDRSEPLFSTFLDLGALETQRDVSSLCVFSRYGDSVSLGHGVQPMPATYPSYTTNAGCYCIQNVHHWSVSFRLLL